MRYQENPSGMGTIIGLAVGGVGIYLLGNMLGWWGTSTSTTTPTTPTTPSGTNTTPAVPLLTAAMLATTPYSATTQPQFSGLSSAVNALIQAGQIPQIQGGSDLEYMLGWGPGTSGQTETIYGQTYKSDGTNWNLVTTAATTPPTTTPPPTTPPPSSGLTAAALATTPYTSAQTSQFGALNPAVDALLQAGSVPTIDGNSDLAYMLGWGGASKGATQTVYGYTYTYDGANWQLGSTGGAGNVTADSSGNCPAGYVNVTGTPGGLCVKTSGQSGYGMGARTQTRAYRINYVRKPRFA